MFSQLFYEHVVVTPLTLYRGPVSPWQGLWLKDETKQVAKSFKFRGNFHRLLEEPAKATVVTASTGNHALGMSTAAKILELKPKVFVPRAISRVKVQAITQLGATVTLVDGGYDECTGEAIRFSAKAGISYISSLDDPSVVQGHSSLFHEILEQHPHGFDVLFVPVGGGGLLAGCLYRYRSMGIKVVGVELASVPSMKLALATGERHLLPPAKSCAEGMLVRKAGALPYQMAREYENLEIVLVSEGQIQQTIRLLWESNGIRAEGAGASAVAAALQYQQANRNHKAIAVISGGNIDESTFQEALSA